MKKKKTLLLRFLVLLLSVLFLIHLVDFPLVFSYIQEVPLLIVMLLLFIGILRTWLTGIRWRLLNPDQTQQLTGWQYFRFLMIANTYNLIMPGALGGDFIKTFLTLKAVRNKKADNLIAIIVDRFVGLLSILFLGTLAFILMKEVPQEEALRWFFLILYAGVFVAVVLALHPGFHAVMIKIFRIAGTPGKKLSRLPGAWQDALTFFSGNKRKVIQAFLLCLPIHCVSFVSAYILAIFLNIEISFYAISLITALVWLVTSIPITISGAGIRELSFIYLMSFYGVDAEPATALSLYKYILTLILGIMGLLFWFDFSKLFLRLRK